MARNGNENLQNQLPLSVNGKGDTGGEVKSPKRNRGGQPGNINALKHGFYSNGLSPAETTAFLEVLRSEHIDAQEAIFRVKLKTLIETGPDNSRARNALSFRMAEYYRIKHRLDKKHSKELRQIMKMLIDHVFLVVAAENKKDLPYESGILERKSNTASLENKPGFQNESGVP